MTSAGCVVSFTSQTRSQIVDRARSQSARFSLRFYLPCVGGRLTALISPHRSSSPLGLSSKRTRCICIHSTSQLFPFDSTLFRHLLLSPWLFGFSILTFLGRPPFPQTGHMPAMSGGFTFAALRLHCWAFASRTDLIVLRNIPSAPSDPRITQYAERFPCTGGDTVAVWRRAHLNSRFQARLSREGDHIQSSNPLDTAFRSLRPFVQGMNRPCWRFTSSGVV